MRMRRLLSLTHSIQCMPYYACCNRCSSSVSLPNKKDVSECDDFGEPFRKPFIKPAVKAEAKLESKFYRKDIERVRPKEDRLSPDIDWASYWPAAQSFRASTVPLPVRMGFSEKKLPSPKKYGNLELMKIPNFLHLTPQAIQRHCHALKQFCTPFPPELKTDAECLSHFPVTMRTSDYVHDGPNIRDIRARVVHVQVDVKSLDFDEAAKDKMRLICKDKFDEGTNAITILAESCPSRSQNEDYAFYLLTAIYYESKKRESWENLKSRKDMRVYAWDASSSQQKLFNFYKKLKDNRKLVSGKSTQDPSEAISKTTSLRKVDDLLGDISDDVGIGGLRGVGKVDSYATAWEEYMNQGETQSVINKYDTAVRILLALPNKL